MSKVVLNKCFGGFSLSPEAMRAYMKRKGKDIYCYEIDYETLTYVKKDFSKVNDFDAYYTDTDFGPVGLKEDIEDHLISPYLSENRTDPDLVAIVELLGSCNASGRCSLLKVVEIPDDVNDWYIEDYDGVETVHEKHRSW